MDLRLWDSTTDVLFIAHLDPHDFITFARMGAASSNVERIRAALAGGLTGLASGSLEDNDQDRFRIAHLAAQYAGTTLAFANNRNGWHRCNFVILGYHCKNGDAVTLRPFTLCSHQQFIEPDVLLKQINKVMRLDQANHPDWF